MRGQAERIFGPIQLTPKRRLLQHYPDFAPVGPTCTCADMQELTAKKYAVFLDGPIGIGKTTYSKNLATEFTGHFIDGDDYSAPNLPWYASSLSTNRHILNAILKALASAPIVFVAYPIRCTNWIFYQRRLRAQQVETVFIGLQANLSFIADSSRSRRLSKTELRRSSEMIAQGYGRRAFSDFFVQADAGSERYVTELAKVALEKRILGGI
ncbi:MAG: hypothetical protein AAF636_15410, partial [Pseudomonadota bacterium]